MRARKALSSLVFLILLGGCSAPSLLITPVSNINRLDEVTVSPGQGWGQSKIAIIEVEGMLMNARSDGLLGPGENKLSLFTQQLETAERDSAVKAIVLRINSPGGTVMCSDTMYQQLLRFKQTTHKPIVASCQEVAASGAYYLACASDQIVASPTSVVGSIGVIFQSFNVVNGLSKIGISADAIKSGPHKDMGSPFKNPVTPEANADREIMQTIVNEFYARFVSVVRTNRRLNDADLPKLTDGRVFSGEEAARVHLVDRVGLLNDAIDVARQLAGANNAKVVMYKRPNGYEGSIYANTNVPTPQAQQQPVVNLPLPTSATLPRGFYYLWEP